MAHNITNQWYHQHECNSGTCPHTGSQLEYRHFLNSSNQPQWVRSFSNELGRLSQGIPPFITKGTDTIQFTHKHHVPSHKRITYGRIGVEEKPNKAEKFRTRLTIGGNLIHYDGALGTPTADLPTIKLLLNQPPTKLGYPFQRKQQHTSLH